jgi:septum formation protein
MSVDRRLVLASASPARLALMRQAGLAPEVVVSQVDESTVRAARVGEQVALLAAARPRRSRSGRPTPSSWRGLAAGVPRPGHGKPADAHEARDRWQRIAGRSGVLHTGQALFDVQGGSVVSRDVAVVSTVVHFASPTPQEVEAYLATGEPLAVAGAFTLDGSVRRSSGGWTATRRRSSGCRWPRCAPSSPSACWPITDLWRR